MIIIHICIWLQFIQFYFDDAELCDEDYKPIGQNDGQAIWLRDAIDKETIENKHTKKNKRTKYTLFLCVEYKQ